MIAHVTEDFLMLLLQGHIIEFFFLLLKPLAYITPTRGCGDYDVNGRLFTFIIRTVFGVVFPSCLAYLRQELFKYLQHSGESGVKKAQYCEMT